MGWAWWRMPVIPALGRLRQKGEEFQASLDYEVRPSLDKILIILNSVINLTKKRRNGSTDI
jgi:hypothetical protein